jgi:polysaccharide export outer membrane protein
MRTVFYFLGIALLSACVSHKQVTYFNDIQEEMEGVLKIPESPENRLKPGDLIEINIASVSLETNQFFQKPASDGEEGFGGNTYQVSKEGAVEIPLVGKVHLGGLTLEEASETIKEALLEYVQKPTVNVRLVNFRVTLLGEVKNPGVYQIPTAEANVLEAIGYAGDLTVYGVRNNVLVIRTDGEEKRFHRLNLNDSGLMESDFFHLRNNDIIYVQPTKGLTSKDDNIYRILPLVISSLTFVAVVISLNQ